MRQDEQAVSAVIATLLLVITIVSIASAVAFMGYKLVSGQDTQRPDYIGMVEVEGEPEARVVHTQEELDWFADFRTDGTCTPLLNGGPFPTAEGTLVKATDILTCNPGEDLRVIHRGKNQDTVLYSFHFEP